ncbi:MAG: ribonuclease P protein component [Candidatus Omnitrophica bacterium]|nr:ribonuclease P protein component [Candidatus Omnitrophota bacterium]
MTAGEGFSKKERLLKSKDFRVVYEKGRKVSVGGSAICYLENVLGHNRLGFSISSRNFKLASARNRIRRLFREVYRRNKAEVRSGFDLVLVVKRGLDKNSPHREVESLFKALIKKAGLV